MTPAIPELFLLWHPSCKLGEVLAKRVYAWLRPGNGLGPEVFYRSLAAPGAPQGLPLPLPGEERMDDTAPRSKTANLQIVLIFLDCHMIADAGWRYWLGRLALRAGEADRVLLPVALDSTAYNVPESLRPLNFLRPAGLPLPDEDPPAPPAKVEVVVRSLLKQLTEALCRLLLARPAERSKGKVAGGSGAGDPTKITLFVSHAKADGVSAARRIRDFIYGNTQLAAFYDENDIPFGSAFGRVLNENLAQAHTVALIAVRSARYASRPWCRRELALFRRPRLEASRRGGAEYWRLSPVLVVDAMEPGTRSVGLPEMGNAPLLRWSPDLPDQEEQIVTTILRDSLLAAFHAGLGRTMPDERDCIVLNWVPDATTLLQIPKVQAARNELRVFFPGRSLPGLERSILRDMFPRINFYSFDQEES